MIYFFNAILKAEKIQRTWVEINSIRKIGENTVMWVNANKKTLIFRSYFLRRVYITE